MLLLSESLQCFTSNAKLIYTSGPVHQIYGPKLCSILPRWVPFMSPAWIPGSSITSSIPEGSNAAHREVRLLLALVSTDVQRYRSMDNIKMGTMWTRILLAEIPCTLWRQFWLPSDTVTEISAKCTLLFNAATFLMNIQGPTIMANFCPKKVQL